MAEKFKICCLTYRQLDQLVKNAITQIDDDELELRVVEGLRDGVIEQVNECIALGYDVVLGGGANASIVRESCDIPVLDYKLTPYDYLNAIDEAFVKGSNIAIVSYKYPLSSELVKYINKIGASVTNIVYENSVELVEKLKDCSSVVIGTAYPVEIAVQLGLPHVLIYPGEQSVIDSIFQAKAFAKEIRKNSESARFSRAIINYSTNGIVILNTNLQIIDFNQSSQQIFPTVTLEKGMSVQEVLPFCTVDRFLESGAENRTDIVKVGEREIYQSWIRLTVNNNFIGAVGIFQILSDISRAEVEYAAKQRQLLSQRGFTAKHYFKDICGQSPQLKACISEARTYSKNDSNILIYGETGVGKELFAQSIHNHSDRRNHPFVAINCSAMPETLLESELFGYDDGAFTGSRKSGKKGLFELADGGTMLLDEIGDISPMMQTRLLRVLQEKEIMRVGGERIIPVDVRIIAATHRNLEELNHSVFRKDLLYRLNVLELLVPPLRTRGQDIALLFNEFYKNHVQFEGYRYKIPDIVYEILMEYSFPGNIRELQNVCQRFCLYMTDGSGEKHAQRCMIRAIGEKRLLEDILQKYYVNNQITPKLVEVLGDYFSYSKEKIGEILGVSRTSLWRIIGKAEQHHE